MCDITDQLIESFDAFFFLLTSLHMPKGPRVWNLNKPIKDQYVSEVYIEGAGKPGQFARSVSLI